MKHCHVIIIGAGIGGLTAALSLQRHGLKVSIYEQSSELSEVGAGLVVTPNAMHALNFLGVGDTVAAASNFSSELQIRHYRTGDVLYRRPAGDFYKSKYGAGHFQVHRADLHNALSSAVLASPAMARKSHVASRHVAAEAASVTPGARFIDGRPCHLAPRVGAFATQPWSDGPPCEPAQGH